VSVIATRSGPRRQAGARWVRKLAWLAIPLVLAGEAGHHVLESLGQTLAHHLFHVLFAGTAALVFGIFVAIDVRRHGRPTFSWRLRPPEESEPRPTS
jgi:hypothetical protein